jgi:hypothetical protein
MSDMSDPEEVQRALGRIEGTQGEILRKLNSLSNELGDHRNDDQRNFSSVRNLIDRKITEQVTLRENHLNDQDQKLEQLKQDQDRAKGAGKVILGLLGALATFVGGAVIAASGGHIRFN